MKPIFLAGLARFSRTAFSKTADAYRIAGAVVFLVAAVTCVLLIATGASHQVQYSHDASAALGLGWQVLNGARPHVDFFSGLGALHPALLALAMKVFGPTANVLALLPACLVPIIACAAWALGRSRLPATEAALYAIVTSSLAAGTYWLGGGLRSQTYAMQYNRFGWIALMLLGLYAVLDPDDDEPTKRWRIDDFIAGATFGLIIFHKVNYVGVATVLLLIGFPLRRRRTSFASFFVGFCAALLPMFVFLRFHILGVVADLRQVLSAAAAISDSHLPAIINIIRGSIVQEVLALVVLAIAITSYVRAADRAGALRVIFVTGTIVVGGVAACRGNQQSGDVPTFGLAALVISEMLRRRFGANDRTLLSAAIAIAIVIPLPLRDVGSVVYSAGWHFTVSEREQKVARIRGPSMKPLLFPLEKGEASDQVLSRILSDSADQFLTPFQFAAWVNDGSALLERSGLRAPRVFTLDIVNPFPFTFGWPDPAHNEFFWGAAVWGDQYPPPAAAILATTDAVMIPRRFLGSPAERRFMANSFGSVIASDFLPAGESQLWRLLVRRGLAGNTNGFR